MVEMRNGKKVLITPVSAEDLKDIKVGDIVYLDGSMTTCRDVRSTLAFFTVSRAIFTAVRA